MLASFNQSTEATNAATDEIHVRNAEIMSAVESISSHKLVTRHRRSSRKAHRCGIPPREETWRPSGRPAHRERAELTYSTSRALRSRRRRSGSGSQSAYGVLLIHSCSIAHDVEVPRQTEPDRSPVPRRRTTCPKRRAVSPVMERLSLIDLGDPIGWYVDHAARSVRASVKPSSASTILHDVLGRDSKSRMSARSTFRYAVIVHAARRCWRGRLLTTIRSKQIRSLVQVDRNRGPRFLRYCGPRDSS